MSSTSADDVEKGVLGSNVYLYSGPIDDSGFAELVKSISPPLGIKHDNCLLLLTTNGGSANSAYQIARFISKAVQAIYPLHA